MVLMGSSRTNKAYINESRASPLISKMVQKKTGVLKPVSRFAYYNLGLRKLKWRIFDSFGEDYKSVSLGGIECDFFVSNVIEYHRFHTIVGESRIIEDLLMELNTDDVFFDLGANIGLYTCLVGEKLSAGKVVAFEPHPANYERLNENIQLNEQSARVESLGLSNSQRSAELTVGRNIPGAGGPRVGNNRTDDETVPIELTSGDYYISEHEIVPDVIKIDVEGHEYEVLKGLEKALESHSCRAIYCEIHPDKLQTLGHSTQKVQQLLVEFGYTVERLPMDRFILKAVVC